MSHKGSRRQAPPTRLRQWLERLGRRPAGRARGGRGRGCPDCYPCGGRLLLARFWLVRQPHAGSSVSAAPYSMSTSRGLPIAGTISWMERATRQQSVELAPLLLERDSELETAAHALRRARDGAGRPVLIEGPAGIGKTRLLQAIGETALLEGFDVLTARATEFEREFPFGAVRQLFEPIVAALDEEARADVLSGAAQLGMAV